MILHTNSVDLTKSELKKRIDEKLAKFSQITIECTLIEKYLHKNDPNLLIGIEAELNKRKRLRLIKFKSMPDDDDSKIKNNDNTNSNNSFNQSTNNSIKSYRRSIITNSRTSSVQHSNAMSCTSLMEQRHKQIVNYKTKIQLIEKLCGNLNIERKHFIMKHKPILLNLQAEIFEQQQTKCDIDEISKVFANTFLTQENSTNLANVHQENFFKFMNHCLKRMNRTIEQLRLKNVIGIQKYNKLRNSVNIVSQLKNILLPVGFAQLEIDRREYTQCVETSTNQFLALKTVGAIEISTLASERKLMANNMMSLTNLINGIANVQMVKRTISTERNEIECEIQKNGDKLRNLETLIKLYEAPSIIDNIHLIEQLKTIKLKFIQIQRENRMYADKLKSNRNRFNRIRQDALQRN